MSAIIPVTRDKNSSVEFESELVCHLVAQSSPGQHDPDPQSLAIRTSVSVVPHDLARSDIDSASLSVFF